MHAFRILIHGVAIGICLGGSLVDAAPATETSDRIPVVQLSYGSFSANVSGNVAQFLGMPYAAPPVGHLRFAPPEPPISFSGVQQATTFGAACFQQKTAFASPIVSAGFPGGAIPDSEDCLFINVIRPKTLPQGKRLPVVMWIHGGAFTAGTTSLYDGDTLVERSIVRNIPVIYVSANYRLSAFGFLVGKEAKAAGIGNIGLRDQRFAMEWVQKNIVAFGGDPDKVTIWGESAGGVSVLLQHIINNGNQGNLFRSSFMQSGSNLYMPFIEDSQPLFDKLVTDAGCSNAGDPIACLRALPFSNLSNVLNLDAGPLQLRLSWRPTIDGQVITRAPYESFFAGLFSKVPVVSGSCDDEGTLFSFPPPSISNDAELQDFLAVNTTFEMSRSQSARILKVYPEDITKGSPFGTGTENALTPQFKRLSAIQGDLQFQAQRRFILKRMSEEGLNPYSFLYKRSKWLPYLGSFHSVDIPAFFGGPGYFPGSPPPDFIGTDALVNFVNTGNPNTPKSPASLLSNVDWQPWNSNSTHPPLLTFHDTAPNLTITDDTYRVEGMTVLTEITLEVVAAQH